MENSGPQYSTDMINICHKYVHLMLQICPIRLAERADLYDLLGLVRWGGEGEKDRSNTLKFPSFCNSVTFMTKIVQTLAKISQIYAKDIPKVFQIYP